MLPIAIASIIAQANLGCQSRGGRPGPGGPPREEEAPQDQLYVLCSLQDLLPERVLSVQEGLGHLSPVSKLRRPPGPAT